MIHVFAACLETKCQPAKRSTVSEGCNLASRGKVRCQHVSHLHSVTGRKIMKPNLSGSILAEGGADVATFPFIV
jgi:hypothetical protein